MLGRVAWGVALVAFGALSVWAATAEPRSGQRPLPAYSGWTVDGERLAVSDLIGRRLLFAFMDPGTPEATVLAKALGGIADQRADHNFTIVGVVPGASTEAVRSFVADLGLGAPFLLDARGGFASSLGLSGRNAAIVADAEGYVVRGTERLPIDADAAADMESLLRGWLRLPDTRAGAPQFGERPEAPAFEAGLLDGKGTFELASLRGKPAVVIFFLHTCPHCHRALAVLRDTLAAIPEGDRPELRGISLVNRPTEVRRELAEKNLDFFEVLVDASGSIGRAYGISGNVPVTFLIDREGRIAWRVAGWRDDRDPPLMRMRLAILAGQTPPMLLHSTAYSGDEFCSTCHASEHETWLLTSHAGAYDTLVRHGAERDVECVGCHVVGFEKPGGFALETSSAHLEGVGCETCHGRGGPHLSPGHVQGGDYEPACTACHDAKHSLGFDYATFLPKVSHAANAHLAALTVAEKRALLAERRGVREALLPTTAEYVGSDACSECHSAEHATWKASPHSRAFATLEASEKSAEAECRACHTTGWDRGGFPANGTSASHADLAGVGCESCHGAGGDHVAPDARRRGTILSLGDKCDSCVILQICGSCHDDANDPGFEFVVQEKIDLQRHGTIEAGTGKPLAPGS